ncbi:MAG: hypothetical protein AAF333_10340 [Planctomycetota bacterium]
MKSQEARKFLPAFADGELDVEQNLRVLEQMAMDPVNTKRVLHQQQLRQACGRVMGDPAVKCPVALRQQIEEMAEAALREEGEAGNGESRSNGGDSSGSGDLTPKPGYDDRHDSPVLATIGRWVAPLAVAALLAIVGVVGLNVFRSATSGGYTADGLISASLAERFGDRHASCTLGEIAPYKADLFPTDIDQLDESLAQHVGQELDGAALDLSSLGYDYQVAGVCPIPGDNAVHVIYENEGGNTLSLWIKAYNGKPTLDPGVPYIPPQDHSGRPMMVWREADMVFYLVGDAMDDVKKAQPAIRLASRV